MFAESPSEIHALFEKQKLAKSNNIRRLVFDKNWNNKLLCFNFTVIVPESEKFEMGEQLDIRIKDRFFCYATISNIKLLKLFEIISSGYNLIDCGLEEKEFMNLMTEKYDSKKWWYAKDTNMQLVFLSKIEQLNMKL